ncbi:flagellar basal body-associated FliL family protein [Aliiroseovarius sp. S253]|uniref:flagellar basal body-associated FliL family protein n=1 Tax=Aliiroseovarius sp. S253 TaxID=3415133 RepID=UPI003C7C35AD
MSDADIAAEVEEVETSGKKSKKGLAIGLVGALLLGGGGFYAAYVGMLGGQSAPQEEEVAAADVHELPAVSFVELDPLVISLGPNARNRHLRFRASLEVEPAYEEDVVKLKPRVVDVLNAYLRAVETAMLEDPHSLVKLRAQMLRRIQLVSGEGRVRNLLILEFVLN